MGKITMGNISDLKELKFSTKIVKKYAYLIRFSTLSTAINMDNLWIIPLCITKNVEKWNVL